MRPVAHSFCNRIIPPAPGDEGKVAALHIRVDQEGITSYWQPSPTELEILNKGGSIAQLIVSAQLPPTRIYAITADGGTPQHLSTADVAVEFVNCVEELRAGYGESVTIHSDNESFNGLPNFLITCTGDWTDWEEREFRAEHLVYALREASHQKRLWRGRNPNGLATPDKTNTDSPASDSQLCMMLASELLEVINRLRSCNPEMERRHVDEAILFYLNAGFAETAGAANRRFTPVEADRLIQGIRRRLSIAAPADNA